MRDSLQLSTHTINTSQVCQELTWNGRIIQYNKNSFHLIPMCLYNVRVKEGWKRLCWVKVFLLWNWIIVWRQEEFLWANRNLLEIGLIFCAFLSCREKNPKPNMQTGVTPALWKILCLLQHQTQGCADSVSVSFCLFISQKSDHACTCLYSQRQRHHFPQSCLFTFLGLYWVIKCCTYTQENRVKGIAKMKMNMHQENLLLPCYGRLAAVCPPPPSQPFVGCTLHLQNWPLPPPGRSLTWPSFNQSMITTLNI